MPFESPDLARNESGSPLQDVHSLDALSVPCLLGSVSVTALFLVGLFLVCIRLFRMVVAAWCDRPATLVGQTPYRHHPLQGSGGRRGRSAMAGRSGGSGGGGGSGGTGSSVGGSGPARAAAGLAEHQLRVQSVARDTELGLPPSVPLPDGEEFPGSANHIHIRTPEQEKEIYDGCIRAPPNQTADWRELRPSLCRPARPQHPPERPHHQPLRCLLGGRPVKPSPVIRASTGLATPSVASWPLTVVVPRHSRAPAHPVPVPVPVPVPAAPVHAPATPVPPAASPSPPPAAAATVLPPASSAQLSQYSNNSGTRLSGVRVVGCRTVTPVPSWDETVTSAGRARLQ